MNTLVLALLLILAQHAPLQSEETGPVRLLSHLSPVPGPSTTIHLPGQGKPCVLFIYKACCKPAEQAAHWANGAVDRYGERIDVVGVCVDPPRSIQHVPAWIKRQQVSFGSLADPTGEVARAWGVLAPPAILILDGRGTEVHRTMGFMNAYTTHLNRILDELVAGDSLNVNGSR